MSLWLPDRVYEYITTAAGLMILYNWSWILLSSGRLLKGGKLSGLKRWSGLVLIAAAVAGTLFHKVSRPGFYISLLIVAVIALSDFIVQRVKRKHAVSSAQKDTEHLDVEIAGHHSLPGSEFRIKGIRLRKSKV